MDSAVVSSCVLVDSSGNNVCWAVFALAFPPPFNNSSVVTMCFEVGCLQVQCKEGMCKEFEPDRFSPSDVSAVCFPSGKKMPCSPLVPDGDSNADARASIRVCLSVNEF